VSAVEQAHVERRAAARSRHVDVGLVTEMARSLRRDARRAGERDDTRGAQTDRMRRAETDRAIETARARPRPRVRRPTPLAAPTA